MTADQVPDEQEHEHRHEHRHEHDHRPWYDDVSVPALLRAARSAYASAIRAALGEVGCDDVPGNGIYVIGAVANDGTPLSEIISHLGVSKQAGGQLVDTLVLRGFLDRTPDPDDRRRMTVALTERGQLAAETTRSAVAAVDAELVARAGPDVIDQLRAALGTVIEIGQAGTH
jgi:DNA-binding MarR family transcriptional regulator